MKTYPLEIQNVGDDTYIVMSKGHHDPHKFMGKVREDYDWPLGFPTHLWAKVTPCRCGEHTYHYAFVKQETRGAFPVTYAHEAYGEDSYESKATHGIKGEV